MRSVSDLMDTHAPAHYRRRRHRAEQSAALTRGAIIGAVATYLAVAAWEVLRS